MPIYETKDYEQVIARIQEKNRHKKHRAGRVPFRRCYYSV